MAGRSAGARDVSPNEEELVEAVARRLSPEWFTPIASNGRHLLDNYPGQHLAYRQQARERAVNLIAMIRAWPLPTTPD